MELLMNPFLVLSRGKKSGTDSVSDAGACIASNVNLYVDCNRLSKRFGGYKCFMTINDKEMDQDPTEREVSHKLALYTTTKLNLKDLPRGIGEEEDGIRLKKPHQRRLKKIIFPSRSEVFFMGNMTPDVVVQT
jgi:hypothetical protein